VDGNSLGQALTFDIDEMRCSLSRSAFAIQDRRKWYRAIFRGPCWLGVCW